jgi:ubiquinone/menaquinone biosynthesis C-methylase UbiE
MQSELRNEHLEARLSRERSHGQRILEDEESNWGWRSAAGRLRRERRAVFLSAPAQVPAESARVLEIGCGSGTFTGAIAERFPRLTAIDVSPALLEVARSRHAQVRLLEMDAHRTSFEDNSFDLVLGCSVLHHLEWSRALKEIHRILVPGGSLRFSEPNLANPQIFVQKNWPWLKRRLGDSPDEHAFTRWRIVSDLRAAGFVDASAEPYEFLHPSVPERWIAAVTQLEGWLEASRLREIAGSLRITARKAG